MKMKSISILIVLAMFFTLNIGVYAEDNGIQPTSDNNIGIYHEDGSYQFSNEELLELNKLEQDMGDLRNVSMAQMLMKVAPESYNSLAPEKRQSLQNEIWQNSATSNNFIPIQPASLGFDPNNDSPGWIAYSNSSISKYGASLKGYSSMDRAPQKEKWMLVICEVYSYPANTRVGYSYNYVEDKSFISATVIIDPPTGSYYTWGYHEKSYVNGSVPQAMGCDSYSKAMSYVRSY